MAEVTVSMPLALTPEMIRAVRDNPLTKVEDRDEWHTRLGWLICAYDVLVETSIKAQRGLPPFTKPSPSQEVQP